MKAVANSGRWIVECPRCKSALAIKQFNAGSEFHKFGCMECGYGMAGHRWESLKNSPVNIRIRFYRELSDCMMEDYELPPNVLEIEQALLRRTHPAWRNWLPGMTVQELTEAESDLHFSWTAPRTWAIEIVTASMLNIHLRDNLLETAPAKTGVKGDLLVGSAANAIGRLAVGANTLILVADATQTLGVKWDNPSSPSAASPITAMMFQYAAKVTAGNALLRQYNAGQPFSCFAYPNPPANLDTFTQGFLIATGTYTFRVLGAISPDRGIIDWTVDGTPIVSGQDWYSAIDNLNTIKSTAGVVLTAGAHVLQGKVNGKNASSTNYFMLLTAYWFE